MTALLIAYLLAWAATTAYVGWLAVQNARLAARLDELQTRSEKCGHDDHFDLKAA